MRRGIIKVDYDDYDDGLNDAQIAGSCCLQGIFGSWTWDGNRIEGKRINYNLQPLPMKPRRFGDDSRFLSQSS